MLDKEQLPEEWFKKASHDFATARLAFLADGPTDTIAFLLHQAAEKYLKGHLISKGWQLKKTHDLRELRARATEFDPDFAEFTELARWLTAFYVEERYPSGPPADYSREEIESILEQTEKLIATIKEKTK